MPFIELARDSACFSAHALVCAAAAQHLRRVMARRAPARVVAATAALLAANAFMAGFWWPARRAKEPR